jgi:hypothetical protein
MSRSSQQGRKRAVFGSDVSRLAAEGAFRVGLGRAPRPKDHIGQESGACLSVAVAKSAA